MKFDHAWTLAGKPRGETPEPPPGKRTPALPRLPVCAYYSPKQATASYAPCLGADAASVSRLANTVLARAHTSPPRQDGTTAGLSYPPPSQRAGLGKLCIGQRSHGARRPACGGGIGPPRANRLLTVPAPRVPELPSMLQRVTHAAPSLMHP